MTTRNMWSEQYKTQCVQVVGNESVDDVIADCCETGATFEEDGETCYVVRFPGRFPELYTEESLRRSLPYRLTAAR